MQVVMGQMDIVWEDASANVARVTAALERVGPRAGSLVVLPEMFASGFSMDAARACAGGALAVEAMSGWARRWGCWVVGGVALVDGNGPGNLALGFGPDGAEIFRFRKLHGFSPTGEPQQYRSGDAVGVWTVGEFRVAPLVCYDLRFPEVFRAAVGKGADLMVVIANWPARRERHWLALLQARAIENQAWVIGVNRAGTDPHATYSGRSVVVDPMGVVRLDAGEGERWVTLEVDASEARAWREAFPALKDRRAGWPG